MSAARQIHAIVAKDLLIEWRTRDLLATVGALGLGCVALFAFAVDFTRVPFAQLGAPVLWIAFTFAGMTALSRSFALERENRCMEGLLLSPADPAVVYLGKLAVNVLVLCVLDGFLLLLCWVLLNVGPGAVSLTPEGWGLLALVVAVNAVGFAAVGTLLAVMAQSTRRGDFLLPVMQSVLALPVLICAVIATQRTLAGSPAAEVLAPVQVSAVFDIVFVAVSLVVFDHVVEE